MSLQDWGAIGELLGGVAIIVSFIYVGLQVRQGTKATNAATNQAFSAQYLELLIQLTRADVRDVFWKGLAGLKNLQGGEQVAFMAMMGSILRTWETFYFERAAGRFDSEKYDAWLVQLIDLFGNDGVREYWEIRRHNFSAEFVEYLDKKNAESSPRPMYSGGFQDAP